MSSGARTILIVVLAVLATGGTCVASCLLLGLASEPEGGPAGSSPTSAAPTTGGTVFYCEGMASFETCGPLRCTRQSVVGEGLGPNIDDAKTMARISCQTKVLALGGRASCAVACQHRD